MGAFIHNLEGLKDYKYQGEDHSIVTKYVLKPFWLKFVQIFPLSMAPNLVTLLGFCFILINLITVFIYDIYLNNLDCPRWCYLSYAIGLFLYQTFDACDGIHARRTGQSGPLGELFDHCVDAINTTLSTIVFASVTKMNYSFLLIIAQFGCLFNFYLSTWEEYHTHILYLSKFSGPVEGILMIIILFIITFLFGPEIWTKKLFQINLSNLFNATNSPLSSNLILTFNCTNIYIILGIFSLYFNIRTSVNNVMRAYKKDPSTQYDNTKKAVKGLIPFLLYYLSIFVYSLLIQDYLFAEKSTIFLPFIISIGLNIAFSVGRIIVSHLTLNDFPYFFPPMLIPLFQLLTYTIFGSLLKFDKQSLAINLVYTGLGLSLAIHGTFIYEIIHEITEYLDIYALTIKHPKIA
ncbi:Choline/ethanolaminephosphotransferase [Ascoidea rubescens DSM 1968]|uniref:diacylglycerol cholinephosphotransferase n=1 Tax=Ascoidea rubescens DSM 1968 TaxID=1344418 RepID=A0A1D2VA74_9ASCO|nr:Choline/ethanolaminephosphotransferase [Ascoidea rubescens DSM 1968]ODV58323.1 Choline/ethanolaminephosphotransferase [Ascoidea rubescens DSM 1968]